jgi:hypothetical protein
VSTEQQPAKAHVDLARHPLWVGLEDMTEAYGHTTDYAEARRLAWSNKLAKYNILRDVRPGRGTL